MVRRDSPNRFLHGSDVVSTIAASRAESAAAARGYVSRTAVIRGPSMAYRGSVRVSWSGICVPGMYACRGTGARFTVVNDLTP